MLLLDRGQVVASGAPAEVLKPDILSSVFQWPVSVASLQDGSPQVVPLRPLEFRRLP